VYADEAVRQELTACWIRVTNAGGAAGFPFPPVNADQVAPAVDALAARPPRGPRRNRTRRLLRQAWLAGDRPLARQAPARADDTRDEILMILTPL
jgi:hypothetical protein